MLKRIPLALLLALQVFGSGAASLAHARAVVVAPPGIEASHTVRCAILHDEMRCALCHYTSARVVTPRVFTLAASRRAVRVTLVQPVVALAATVRLTAAPPRAPPPALS